MKKESMTGVLNTLLAVSGMLLIIWWLLLGLSQMTTGAGGSLTKLALTSTWVPINIVGLLSALQFDETFVWPLLARHAEELLQIEGPMFSDPAFFASYLVMGVLFAVGLVFVAAQSLKRRIIPVVPSVFLLVGALLFAGGILVPVIVRAVGVVLLGVSLIWVGFKNRKSNRG